MFFIVNHENSIIAADTDFLEEVGAESVYEAALLIKKGEVILDEGGVSISHSQKDHTFSRTKLSTVWGETYLYVVDKETSLDDKEDKEQEAAEDVLFNLAIPQTGMFDNITDEKESTPIADETVVSEEETFDLSHDEPEDKEKEDILPEDIPFGLTESTETLDDISATDSADISSLGLTDFLQEETAEASTDSSETLIGLRDNNAGDDDTLELLTKETEEKSDFSITDDAVLSILEEDNTEDSVEVSALLNTEDIAPLDSFQIDSPEKKAEEETQHGLEVQNDTSEESEQTVTADFREIAKLIGVSEEEYLHFLDDFEKESVQLEPNLRSNDLKESREALSILNEASLLLHLPHITEKLNGLSHATSNEKSSLIDSFLTLVSQVKNPQKNVTAEATTVPDDNTSETEPPLDLSINPAEELSISAESYEPKKERLEFLPEEASEHPSENTSAVLDQVQPIPFDFSLNEAADELTLPSSLVSEFVIDFIDQAKENLPVLQKAYEERDMDTIEKTAHMLKGASSNLRIAPIAETLYQLQFNQDFTQVPELLALFTGQLKALSLQMDQG